jgi:hypothetical protein
VRPLPEDFFIRPWVRYVPTVFSFRFSPRIALTCRGFHKTHGFLFYRSFVGRDK